MFSKPLDIPGRNFLAVSNSYLGIVDGVFAVFVVKEFHIFTAIIDIYKYYTTYTTKSKDKFDKKTPHFCGL